MKKVFILFMSHRSGEHGLTIHNTIEEVKEEVKSVVEAINDGDNNEKNHTNDLAIVESIKEEVIVEDGFYAELSDTTWFDVFEREV